MIHKRIAFAIALCRDHLRHEQCILANRMHTQHTTVEKRHSAFDQRRGDGKRCGWYAFEPVSDLRMFPREAARKLLLRGGEDRHRKLAGLLDQFMRVGQPLQGDAYQRRLQRNGRERVDRHAILLTVMRGGDYRYTGRPRAHGAAEGF